MDITVQSSKAQAALDKAMNLSGALSSLLSLVIKGFQDQVKKNLRDQGSEYGKWEPASKWITAKKGTSKLFEGADQYVRVRNAPGRSEVVFDSPGNWTLTEHQSGFTVPPTGRIVVLDLKAPAVIGATGSRFAFISRRPSKVPARRMWPTDNKAKETAEPLVIRWAKALEASIAA